MASIVKYNGEINYDDVMCAFLRWWEDGEYCSLKFPFGLGGNISQAMARYKRGVPALSCGGTGFMENGNGALMRMFPFSMYCINKKLGAEETLDVIRKAASLTHAHEINILCCLIYTRFLAGCIRTKNPREALRFSVQEFDYAKHFSPDGLRAVSEILDGSFPDRFNAEKIPESGYVADSLKVALYSSKGCGGIMRVAPAGLDPRMAAYFGGDIAKIDYEAAEFAAITHGHSLGYMMASPQTNRPEKTIPHGWRNTFTPTGRNCGENSKSPMPVRCTARIRFQSDVLRCRASEKSNAFDTGTFKLNFHKLYP